MVWSARRRAMSRPSRVRATAQVKIAEQHDGSDHHDDLHVGDAAPRNRSGSKQGIAAVMIAAPA